MAEKHQTGTVQANGMTFHFIEKGDGPLILCLHGFPDNAYSFEHQFDAFTASGYRVVAPFMRGYAPSDCSPNHQYHAAFLGQDTVEIITALGYDRAVVLGHDFGASAAYAAAIIAPEKISALITSAVPYGLKLAEAMVMDAQQMRRSWYIFYFQTLLAEMAVPADNFRFIDNLWKDWAPSWKYEKTHLDRVKKTLSQTGVLTAALGYYRSPFKEPPNDSFLADIQSRIGTQTISIPTLYIHGDQDGCIGADIASGMESHFSGKFEKKIVEFAGHFVHREVPNQFNQIVLQFLKTSIAF